MGIAGAGGAGDMAGAGGAEAGAGGGAGEAGSPGVPLRVTNLAAGTSDTCALLNDATIRCWGYGLYGELGGGNSDNVGDDELPSSVGAVNVGGAIRKVATGCYHTCALLEGGTVRCWGSGGVGSLGYANTDSIGDAEFPVSAGDVDVGGEVAELATGCWQTCVLLEAGGLRCWGSGVEGELGYANTNDIGDDETPASAGNVDAGGVVTHIEPGIEHTCAILQGGGVRCWGRGSEGELGYANTDNIGDDETPASVATVDLGGKAIELALGWYHTCALLEGGKVRCWGRATDGELGYGNMDVIGDDETPASAGDVDVGAAVLHIVAGGFFTCALTASHEVRCWGHSYAGELGYGTDLFIGDDETPASVGSVDVGGPVAEIAAGYTHVCALLMSGAVRCWGDGTLGALGYGNTDSIGYFETPASAGDVSVF
jgi:alpha-tubulin suppressor-like RCC1 family protein